MRAVWSAAIVLALFASLLVTGCRQVTAPLPDDLVCRHCACWSGGRTASAPVLCSTLGRDIVCCLADSS